MEFDLAFEKYINKERDIEVLKTILQDAYGFLESENYHTHIEVIEELTGIEYE